MARKKGLKSYSDEELLKEITARHADKHFREGMTMTEMELAVERLKGNAGDPAILAMLSRMKPEKPTAKACPKCGKRTPVKARDRERTVRSLSGPVTFKRNYHYCEKCQHGFYPVDYLLSLPEEGELSAEMEKRVLDFAVNDVFGQGAARWNVHYSEPISDNLLRRVAARVGAQCESVDQGHLQEALKPSTEAAEILVVQMDGGMLPIRGEEPWKEAKVGVVYRHDEDARRPVPQSSRYCAVIGTVANFAPVLEELLVAERIDDVRTIIWLGDGAPHNWTLADQVAADAVQILDWYHAVQHAMDCGKVLLGEESAWLSNWQQRAEALLAGGDPEALIRELMDCLPAKVKGRPKAAHRAMLKAVDDLVRYYRNNAHRMRYATYREHGFPIGSGAVESAHRHVLQMRMKRAGQRWDLGNARRMAHLRAAYSTGGAANFHSGIQRAHRDTTRRRPIPGGRRHGFRFARYGDRDTLRASK